MAGIIVTVSWIQAVSVFYPLLSFFYAFLLHEKVMFFLVSIFIRMFLSSLTRQFYWTKLFSKNVFYEGLNSPILKYRFHRLSYPNSKKKKSSQFNLRVLIGGGDEILLQTNLGLGEAIHSEDQNKKKQQEQISRSEQLNFFRKKGEEPKKKRKSLNGLVSR